MPAARTFGRWLLRVAAAGGLALIAAAVVVVVVLPRATHGAALTVLTGSMTPDIPVGSLVLDRPVDSRTLHVGDVATYQAAPGENVYITHRIVAIHTSSTGTTFTFKGDANRGPDLDAVPAAAIRGKVWFHIPYLGTVRDSLESGGGRLVVIGLLVLALAGYAVGQLRAGLRRTPSTEALVRTFPRTAFGAVDPQFVARLLQGVLEVRDDQLVLTIQGSAARLAVLDELLGSYVAEPEAVELTELNELNGSAELTELNELNESAARHRAARRKAVAVRSANARTSRHRASRRKAVAVRAATAQATRPQAIGAPIDAELRDHVAAR